MSYFQTQKKFTLKQAQWQEFLAEFHYTLEYKPGVMNHVTDVLSRKAELAAIGQAETDMKARKRTRYHDKLWSLLRRERLGCFGYEMGFSSPRETAYMCQSGKV